MGAAIGALGKGAGIKLGVSGVNSGIMRRPPIRAPERARESPSFPPDRLLRAREFKAQRPYFSPGWAALSPVIDAGDPGGPDGGENVFPLSGRWARNSWRSAQEYVQEVGPPFALNKLHRVEFIPLFVPPFRVGIIQIFLF